MAMTQKERQQVLGLLIAIALAGAVGFWVYWRTPKELEAQVMQMEMDSLRAKVDSAKVDLQQGTVESLRLAVTQFEGALSVMRELVPTGNEIVRLIDSISTRATRRGVRLASFNPIGADEFQPPFQVQRYSLVVLGPYDHIGEFLSDVASLRRIMVPYAVQMQPASASDIAGMIIEEGLTYLRVTLSIKTFVQVELDEFGNAVGGA
ncbi:MAG: type 4a pilus biogenesis protein PilO [Gemmatimonadetes bacterium]|nr:type 4a pilus biogenesis protein PilO [Gemmatimonadota bacterium]